VRISRMAVRAGMLTIWTAWASVLVLFGIAVGQAAIRGDAPPGSLWGAAASIAAGQFVFLALVADRLCPLTRRRLADVLELTFAAICATSALVWVLS